MSEAHLDDNLHVPLRIRFIHGFTDWNGKSIIQNFTLHYSDGDKKHPRAMGLCIYSNFLFFREASIFIVKQKNIYSTMKVFVHEIAHALIWHLYLPIHWNRLVEKYL